MARRSFMWIPWAVAVVSLLIALAGSGFRLWLPVAIWLAVLGLAWLLSRRVTLGPGERIGLALMLLPILLLLGWEGGWWLIPADLTWLAIEVARGGGASLSFRR